MILFGYLMDKRGEKQIIGWGSILLGFSALLLMLVNNYAVLLFLLLIVGVWYGSAQTGAAPQL